MELWHEAGGDDDGDHCIHLPTGHSPRWTGSDDGIRTAPFYGAKTCGTLLCTLDGIQIDQNMNAVDTNNEPIPGLYVVGNDSGGYFSGTYPNLSTGAACGRTVTFGRRAGRIAAPEGI